MEGVTTHGARRRLRVRQIAARDRTRKRGTHDDLAPLADAGSRARRRDQFDLNQGSGLADRADRASSL